MFHVTLVRPALISSPTSYSEPLTPPIGLAYLAGTLVADGVKVTAIDAIGEAPQNYVLEQDYRCQGLAINEVLQRMFDERIVERLRSLNADFREANFCGAHWGGYVNEGSNYFPVEIEDAYLTDAIADAATGWPEGFDPEAAGVVFK